MFRIWAFLCTTFFVDVYKRQVLSLGLPLVDGGEMEAGKTNRQGRWRNDALDLYLRSFDIPYDEDVYKRQDIHRFAASGIGGGVPDKKTLVILDRKSVV